MFIKFCPSCGAKALKVIGISGKGTIYKCAHCNDRWTIEEYETE